MATYVGEALVKVLPTAKTFHKDLKKEIEKLKNHKHKIEVPIEVKGTEDALQDMKYVAEARDKLDGTEATIKIYVDDKDARSALDRLLVDTQDRDMTISSRLEVNEESIKKANRQMEAFRDENSQMETWVDLRTDTAESAFDQFRKRHAEMEIVPKFSQAAKMPSIPSFNSKVIEQEWNSVNLIPKLYEKMNAQFEIGVRQIYDPYLRRIRQLYNAAATPFRAFTDVANQVSTINELTDGLAKRINDFRGKHVETIQPIAKAFSGISKAVKGLPTKLQELGRKINGIKAPPALKNFANTLQSLQGIVAKGFGKMPSFSLPVFESIKDGLDKAKNYISSQARRVSEPIAASFRNTFTTIRDWMDVEVAQPVMNSFSRLGMRLRGTFQNISADFLTTLGNMGRWFPFIDSMTRSIQGLGGGLKNSFLNTIQGGIAGLLNSFQPLADRIKSARVNLSTMFAVISRGTPLIDRVKGSFDRMSLGVRKSLAGLGLATNIRFNSMVMGMQAATKRMGTAFNRGMSRIADSKAVKAFSSGISKILNNKQVYTVLRAATQRISGIIMGGMRMAIGAFSQLGTVIMKSVVPALGAAAVGIGLLAGKVAIAGVMALGGAIMSVAQGALLMAPALGVAAGISFAVVKMGLKDVQAGVSAAFNVETAEEFEEVISKMPASVQEIARAFRGFKPEIDALQRTVQDNLLKDLRPGIESMMNNLLPSVTDGMGKLATEWNGALKNVLTELSSDEASAGLAGIMEGVLEMAREMQPTLANFTRAFGALAAAGAKWLGPLGKWVNEASEAFADWSLKFTASPEGGGMSDFDKAIERSIDNAKLLGAILGGLGGTLWNVLKAGSEGGAGMLQGMADGAQKLKEITSEGTEGYANMVAFMEDATELAVKLGDLIEPAFNLIMSVGTTLANLGTGALPGVTAVVDALSDGLEPLEGIAEGFGARLGGGLSALTPFISNIGNILAPLLGGLSAGLGQALQGLGWGLQEISEPMQRAGEALAPVLSTVGAALGDLFVAAAPIVAGSFDMIAAMAPVLQNVIGWLGQIGTAVLDALAPIFAENDEFYQTLATGLMPAVDQFFGMILDFINMIAPMIPPIVELFYQILEWVTPFLPLIASLGAAFLGMSTTVKVAGGAFSIFTKVKGMFGGIIGVVKTFGGLFLNLGSKIIPVVTGAWKLLSAAFALSPIGVIITAVVALVGALIYFFTQTETGRALWDKFTAALGAGWDWVTDKLSQGWNWIVDNIWTPFTNWLTNLRLDFETFVAKMVHKFQNMRDAFKAVVDYIKDKVLDFFKARLEDLKDKVGNIVDGIKKVWDTIQKIFADPVVMFLDLVVNGGIVKGWNWVNDKLGGKLGEMSEVPIDSGLRFASGGVLPGYTPGKDVHDFVSPTGGRLHLSGGEAIMRPEWTRAVGGPTAVERMNKAARMGQLSSRGAHSHSHARGGVLDLGSFANGGVLQKNANVDITTDIQRSMERAVAAAFPNQIITSGTRYEDVGSGFDNHMAGRALDFAPSQALASWIQNTYPNSAELFWDAGPNIKNGNPTGAIGGHSDHVHWAMASMVDPYTGDVVSQDGPGGGGGGGFFDFAGAVMSKAKDWLGGIFSPIKDRFSEWTVGFDNFIPLAAAEGFRATTDHVIEKMKDLGSSILSLLGFTGGGGGVAWDPGAGAEQWRPGVVDAFNRQGEEPHQHLVDALVRQIWTESKGDPNVAQQIVDVNGTGPSAGMGLYQFIPSTWAAYRDPSLPNDRTNPEAAHNAAVRYFRDFHHWNTGPGGVGLQGTGWKTGGVLPENLTSLFDQGGVANGIGQMEKRTIHPERVLSPNQTKAFNDFVYRFMPQLIEDWRRQPFDIQTGVNRITAELARLRKVTAEQREVRITGMSYGIQGMFEDQIDGTKELNKVDFDALTNIDPRDVPTAINELQAWLDNNTDKLSRNIEGAAMSVGQVVQDPWGYLEAEERAKQRIDEEREAAREEAKKERDEERQKAREEEDKARQEKEQAELDAAESEEEKEKIQARLDEEAEKRQEAESEIQAKDQEADQAEQERIDALKASGEYYYGYKVYGNDGSNPNARDKSDQQSFAEETSSAVAGKVGFGAIADKINQRVGMVQSVSQSVDTAMPAWFAAANGDYAGLNHNAAVATSLALEDAETQARDLGPTAIADFLEMAVSANVGAPRYENFIGNVYTGMSKSEFKQAIEEHEAKAARRGGGTTRTR